MKKIGIILGTIAILGIIPAQSVHATVTCPDGTEALDLSGCPVTTNNEPEADNLGKNNGAIDEPVDEDNLPDDTAGETTRPDIPTDNGEDKTNPDDEETENSEETPTWPMFVSLGALGGMALLVILLNLFGRKK